MVGISPAPGATRGLFGADAGDASPAPGVVRRRETDVDVAQLGLGSLSPAGRLLLNLFRDAEFVAVRVELESTPTGSVWVGELEGVAASQVILAVGSEGVFSASIMFPGSIYSVVPTPSGRHVIAQVDPTALPPPG